MRSRRIKNFVRLRPSLVEKQGKATSTSEEKIPGQCLFGLVRVLPLAPCQGEGRGFESRRPLQVDRCFALVAEHFNQLANHLATVLSQQVDTQQVDEGSRNTLAEVLRGMNAHRDVLARLIEVDG